MNPNLRTILIIIGLVTLLLLGIFVVPRGLSLYYQMRGGQHVEYVLRTSEGIQELVCEELPANNKDGRNEIEQAVVDLNRAIRFNENNAQAYYYLGKANCFLGNPSNAKEDYLKYSELRPDNPLGYIGLGFAHFSIGIQNSIFEHNETCRTKSQNEEEIYLLLTDAASNFKDSRISGDQMSQLAGKKFYQGDFQKAVCYFLLADILNPQKSPGINFIRKLASTSLAPDLDLERINELPVVTLNNSINIAGSDLYWIEPIEVAGNQLSEYSSGGSEAGVLWWKGRAVLLIWVEHEGTYKISLRANHRNSDSGELQIERDMQSISTFSVNQSWNDYSAELLLTEGFHIVSFRYIEDLGDVMLDKIRIEKLPLPDS